MFGTFIVQATMGGVVVPLNKFGELAPYICLAATIIASTAESVVYVRCVKRKREKQ